MNVKPSSQPGTIDGCIAACGQLNYTYAGGEVKTIQKLDPPIIQLYPVNVVFKIVCLLVVSSKCFIQ